ncbi:MAG: hypothetical protein R2855_04605 [Thermomicrobiales bacterium]
MRKIVDRRRMEREARECSIGKVQIEVDEPARGLTLAEQQTVEIAKAISLDVRVLIMDEPTASLSAHEVRRLFRIISNLRAQVAILFISHRRMDEGFRDFRYGHDLARRSVVSAPTVRADSRMAIRDMVGRQVVESFTGNTVRPVVRLAVEG